MLIRRDLRCSNVIAFCYHSFTTGDIPMIYAVDYTGNFKHVASRFVGVHKGWQTNENAHCISIVSVSITRTMEVIEHAHYDHWIFKSIFRNKNESETEDSSLILDSLTIFFLYFLLYTKLVIKTKEKRISFQKRRNVLINKCGFDQQAKTTRKSNDIFIEPRWECWYGFGKEWDENKIFAMKKAGGRFH